MQGFYEDESGNLLPRPDNVGGSYGGSLIKGNISNLTGIPSTLANMGAEVVSALDFGKGVDFQTAYNKKLADEAYKKALANNLPTISQIQPAMPTPAQQAVAKSSGAGKSQSSALKKEMARQAESRAQIDRERDSYY